MAMRVNFTNPPPMVQEQPQEAPSVLAQALTQQQSAPLFNGAPDTPQMRRGLGLAPDAGGGNGFGGLANPSGNNYGLSYGQTFMGQQPIQPQTQPAYSPMAAPQPEQPQRPRHYPLSPFFGFRARNPFGRQF